MLSLCGGKAFTLATMYQSGFTYQTQSSGSATHSNPQLLARTEDDAGRRVTSLDVYRGVVYRGAGRARRRRFLPTSFFTIGAAGSHAVDEPCAFALDVPLAEPSDDKAPRTFFANCGGRFGAT